MPRSSLPKFVSSFRDRHGRLRYRFRRNGVSVYLIGIPWSPPFMVAYGDALGASEPQPQTIGAARIVPGTLNALITVYLDPASSSLFKTRAAETQRTQRNILENFAAAHGDKPLYHTNRTGRRVMLLTREHLQTMVNAKAATPFAQRNFLNTVRIMFRWAKAEGRIPDDPSLGVTRESVKTTGYPTWSETQIARFEAAHAIGTKARLAFALLLYTGQRRSDVVCMGPQHVVGDTLMLDQRKTEAHLEIPLHPTLAAIIAATPTVGMKSFLVTHFGKPYTAPGFGNWFRALCDAAGLPEVSAHGLRKATARRLAEMGCSANQIAAITGHVTLSEVARYTKAADRRRMAREAIGKLIEGGW
jgi:integrase